MKCSEVQDKSSSWGISEFGPNPIQVLTRLKWSLYTEAKFLADTDDSIKSQSDSHQNLMGLKTGLCKVTQISWRKRFTPCRELLLF